MNFQTYELKGGIKFSVPCCVWTNNDHVRDQILEWCAGIGYRVCQCASFEGWNTITCSMVERNGILFPEVHGVPDKDPDTGYSIDQFKEENAKESSPSIDCGNNFLMFKMLAALNEENDQDQWFIDRRGHWMLCGLDSFDKFAAQVGDGLGIMGKDGVRKATAADIIDRFRGENNL